MYYPFSENKGADQLRGYREADLRLCFRICKMPVFLRRGSYSVMFQNFQTPQIFAVIILMTSTEKFYHGVMLQKDADKFANSEDPDETAFLVAVWGRLFKVNDVVS